MMAGRRMLIDRDIGRLEAAAGAITSLFSFLADAPQCQTDSAIHLTSVTVRYWQAGAIMTPVVQRYAERYCLSRYCFGSTIADRRT